MTLQAIKMTIHYGQFMITQALWHFCQMSQKMHQIESLPLKQCYKYYTNLQKYDKNCRLSLCIHAPQSLRNLSSKFET